MLYNCCIINLFAETILHVGQVPMLVLYIGIIKVWGFLPKNPTYKPTKYLAWQHWLGIAKPKNVLRSTLNLSIKLLWNFNFFLFNGFFYWLTNKHNPITIKAMGLISSLFNVALSGDVPTAAALISVETGSQLLTRIGKLWNMLRNCVNTHFRYLALYTHDKQVNISMDW